MKSTPAPLSTSSGAHNLCNITHTRAVCLFLFTTVPGGASVSCSFLLAGADSAAVSAPHTAMPGGGCRVSGRPAVPEAQRERERDTASGRDKKVRTAMRRREGMWRENNHCCVIG